MASSSAQDPGQDSQPEYRYLQEIAQMMFVFGEVVDPHPDVLKLVEDIVRTQVIEMIIQSRRLAQRRASRFLAPEDLIFLIRYDRAKVNRLRTYLSWKDVRKNAKDSGGAEGGGAGAGGGGGVEVDGLGEEAVENPVKSRKMKIKLPWEVSTVYSEHLRPAAGDEAEDEDEDDIEAHEDSLQRLKDADEATRRMTREEYVHYSECRQASFTFRKGKRFREFINAGAYLDVKPNDDIIDILGFLAFEVVRELCLGAVAVKRALEEQQLNVLTSASAPVGANNGNGALTQGQQNARQGNGQTQAQNHGDGEEDEDVSNSSMRGKVDGDGDAGAGAGGDANQTTTSPRKRKTADTIAPSDDASSKRARTSGGAENEGSSGPGQGPGLGATSAAAPVDGQLCSLFSPAPAKASPLRPAHVHEAFARLQRGRAALASGTRGGGAAGGLRRTRVFVI